MRQFHVVLKQCDSAESGWLEVGKFGTERKAAEFAESRERADPQRYQDGNPEREYYAIELV
jgi:hypothetical protein